MSNIDRACWIYIIFKKKLLDFLKMFSVFVINADMRLMISRSMCILEILATTPLYQLLRAVIYFSARLHKHWCWRKSDKRIKRYDSELNDLH